MHLTAYSFFLYVLCFFYSGLIWIRLCCLEHRSFHIKLFWICFHVFMLFFIPLLKKLQCWISFTKKYRVAMIQRRFSWKYFACSVGLYIRNFWLCKKCVCVTVLCKISKLYENEMRINIYHATLMKIYIERKSKRQLGYNAMQFHPKKQV